MNSDAESLCICHLLAFNRLLNIFTEPLKTYSLLIAEVQSSYHYEYGTNSSSVM